jgi:hypothetical protein
MKLKLENLWKFSWEKKSIYEANKGFIDTYSAEKYKKAVIQIVKDLNLKM